MGEGGPRAIHASFPTEENELQRAQARAAEAGADRSGAAESCAPLEDLRPGRT